MKKRRVTYPVARTANRPVRGTGLAGERPVRTTLAEINVRALDGRTDISIGDSVRIAGGGLYAGEFAVIDSIVGGVIPAAMVRTAAGKTRRVRMIDLERVAAPEASEAGEVPPGQ